MSSGDDDNKSSRRSSRVFDVDAADLDRYLSGGKRKQAQGTARQLQQFQESVDRANRGRPSAISGTSERTPTDQTSSRRGSGNTSYVTDSAYRQNRRRSYMNEDPYVTGIDEDVSFEPVVSEPVAPRYKPQPEPRQPAYDYPEYEDDLDQFADEHVWEEEPEYPEPVSPAPARQPQRRRPSVQRPNLRKPTIPPIVANAAVLNDTPSLAMLVGSTLGLAVMAVLLANRLDALPANIFSHVSASGKLEHEAHRGILWNLPLGATMMTIMNLVAAWFLAPTDKFASRFLLGGSLIVQFVVWIAVFKLMW